jgi:AbrB family looped-hinge helix DNA binding protein
MESAKISSKGQLVIPKYLRDALHLTAGSEVMIEKSDNKLIVMKKPDDPVKGLVNAAEKVAIRNVRRHIKEE